MTTREKKTRVYGFRCDNPGQSSGNITTAVGFDSNKAPRTGRELPEDLRHLPPADDGFQMIPPDLAIVLLIVGLVLGYVLGAFSRAAS